MVNAENLVGAHEIAERLALSRAQLVHDWKRRYPDFPEPVARLSAGLVWDFVEIEQWVVSTGRADNVVGDGS